MGALLGFSAIPDHYRKDLELIETLEDIAEGISSDNQHTTILTYKI